MRNVTKRNLNAVIFLVALVIFFYSRGKGLPKNYSDEEGPWEKKREVGGHTIFKLHSSKFHQPPLPIRNEWSVDFFVS